MSRGSQREINLLVLLTAYFICCNEGMIPDSENIVPIHGEEKELLQPPLPIEAKSSSENQDVPLLIPKKLNEETISQIGQITTKDQIKSSSFSPPAMIDETKTKERVVEEVGESRQDGKQIEQELIWPKTMNELSEIAKQNENNGEIESNIQAAISPQVTTELIISDIKPKKHVQSEQVSNPPTGTNEVLEQFQVDNKTIKTSTTSSELEFDTEETTTLATENPDSEDDKDLSPQDPFQESGDAVEQAEIEEHQPNHRTTTIEETSSNYNQPVDDMINSTMVPILQESKTNYTVATVVVGKSVIVRGESNISENGEKENVKKESNENENNNDVIHKNELWSVEKAILPTITTTTELLSSMTSNPSEIVSSSSINIDILSALNVAAAAVIKNKKLITTRIIDRLPLQINSSQILGGESTAVQSQQSRSMSSLFADNVQNTGQTISMSPTAISLDQSITIKQQSRSEAINELPARLNSTWLIQSTKASEVSKMESSASTDSNFAEMTTQHTVTEKSSSVTKSGCAKEDKSEKVERTTVKVTTPMPVDAPAAFVVVILSVPWLTVCLHEAELRSTLADQLTGLGTWSVQPSQVVLLGSIDRWPDHLGQLGGASGLCAELQSSRGTPIVLMAYIEGGGGQVDVGLTTALGKALLRHEIKLPGNEFQNVILEVHLYPKDGTHDQKGADAKDNYMGIVAAFTISGIAGTSLLLLCILLLVLRHRHQKQQQKRRCRPAVLDTYSLDSISIYSSVRRKKNSVTKLSYLNLSFTDPTVPSHQINFAGLANACTDQDSALEEEFKSIPMKHSKLKDLPPGVEDKNRYSNIIPIPETRVQLLAKKDEPKSNAYINANYVRGHKDKCNAYIACQTPLESTVGDFWRMVWEQQSRVIIMLTQVEEEEMLKCAPYFPDSEFENNKLFGDYQITLKNKEVLHAYTIYTFQIRELEKNLVRTITQFWYTAWPPNGRGVPDNYCSILAMLLEARPLATGKNSGPMIVHCSSGTGRTGTIIAIDICMQQFEDCRIVDIPRSVFMLRQQRAGAVQTVAQYKFLYNVLNEYASRLANSSLRSSIRSNISTCKKL